MHLDPTEYEVGEIETCLHSADGDAALAITCTFVNSWDLVKEVVLSRGTSPLVPARIRTTNEPVKGGKQPTVSIVTIT